MTDIAILAIMCELRKHHPDGRTSRQLEDSIPPRLWAWLWDALRDLRDTNTIACTDGIWWLRHRG
jgi:hypothetical protein